MEVRAKALWVAHGKGSHAQRRGVREVAKVVGILKIRVHHALAIPALAQLLRLIHALLEHRSGRRAPLVAGRDLEARW